MTDANHGEHVTDRASSLRLKLHGSDMLSGCRRKLHEVVGNKLIKAFCQAIAISQISDPSGDGHVSRG